MAYETVSRLDNGLELQEDFRRWVVLLVKRRWWLAAITSLSIVAATVIAFVVTPIYEAKTTLMPTENRENGLGLNGTLGQLGGLAALAGFEGVRNRTVIEAVALLKSRKFTEDFIRDENLLPDLFHNRWDSRSNRWKPGAKVPDLWRGYRLFDKKIRFVDQDEKTGIVTLRIDWSDRQQAADWANELVKRVNAEMQQRALAETQTTLEYLKEQTQATQVASVQNALQDLIEQNLKEQAIAHVRSDFAFRVIDPAAVPDLKDRVRPHRILYVIVGAFFGVLLSLLVIMGVEAMQNVRQLLKSERSVH